MTDLQMTDMRMPDLRMTAQQRARLTWGRSGGRVRQGTQGAAGAAARGAALGLAYQPVYDLDTDLVVATEVRMALPPAAELPAVSRVVDDLARVPRTIDVRVPVSAATVVDLPALLASTAADLRHLTIEITGDRTTSWDDVADATVPLRRLGVHVALDDRDLRHAGDVRPDVVTLDVTVAQGIDTDPVKRTLAAGAVRVAGYLGAAVTARGIETDSELDVLRALGVHHGQGPVLGRAAPLPWTIGSVVAR